MIYPMTNRIYEALSKVDGLKPYIDEQENISAVYLIFKKPDGHGGYMIHFISRSKRNDVLVRAYKLLYVGLENRLRMLPVLNHLNDRFRYAKFLCDDNGYVNVEYDFFMGEENPEDCANEIQQRLVMIIEQAYPVMKAELDDIRGAMPGDEAEDVLAEIRTVLEANSCECTKREGIGASVLFVPVSIGGKECDVRFIRHDDGRLEVCLYTMMTLDEAQGRWIQPQIGILNQRADGLEFEVDRDGDVNIRYSYPDSVTDPASSAYDMYCNIVSAAHEAVEMIRDRLSEEDDDEIVFAEDDGEEPEDEDCNEEKDPEKKLTDRIKTELESHGYRCCQMRMFHGDGWRLTVKVVIDGQNHDLDFTAEPGDLQLCLYQLVNTHEEEREIVSRILRDVGEGLTDIEISCDSDGDVNICCDYTQNADHIVENACDMVRRFTSIGRDVIRKLRGKLHRLDWTMSELQNELEANDCECEQGDPDFLDMERLYVNVMIDGREHKIGFYREPDGSLSVRLFMLMHVSDEQRRLVDPVLEQINEGLTECEVVCDKDNDINISFDYGAGDGNPVESAYWKVIHFTAVGQEVMNRLGKLLEDAGGEEHEERSWTLQELRDAMEACGYSCIMDSRNESGIQLLTVKTKMNGRIQDVDFFHRADGMLDIRMFALMDVEEEDRWQVMNLLRSINAELDGMRVFCSRDGRIDLCYDFREEGVNPVEVAQSLVERTTEAASRTVGRLREMLSGGNAEPEPQGWSMDELLCELERHGCECELTNPGGFSVQQLRAEVEADGRKWSVNFYRPPFGGLDIRMYDLMQVDTEDRKRVDLLLKEINEDMQNVEAFLGMTCGLSLRGRIEPENSDIIAMAYDRMMHFIHTAPQLISRVRAELKESEQDDAWTLEEIRTKAESMGYTCRMCSPNARIYRFVTVEIPVDGQDIDMDFFDIDGRLEMNVFRLFHLEDAAQRDAVEAVLADLRADEKLLELDCDRDGDINIEYVFPPDASGAGLTLEELVEHVKRLVPAVRNAIRQKLHGDDDALPWTLDSVMEELEAHGYPCEMNTPTERVRYLTAKLCIDDRVREMSFFEGEDGRLRIHIFMLYSLADDSERGKVEEVLRVLNARYDSLHFQCDQDDDVNINCKYPDDMGGSVYCVADLVQLFTGAAREMLRMLRTALGDDGEKPDAPTDLSALIDGLLLPEEQEDTQDQTRRKLEGINRGLLERGCQSELIDLEMFELLFVDVTLEADSCRHNVRFCVDDRGKLTARLAGYLSVESPEDCGRLRIMLQFLNARVEMVHFECDDDGDVSICYEYPDDVSDPAETAYELLQCFADAVREAAPLKKLFGDAE